VKSPVQTCIHCLKQKEGLRSAQSRTGKTWSGAAFENFGVEGSCDRVGEGSSGYGPVKSILKGAKLCDKTYEWIRRVSGGCGGRAWP